MKTGFDSELAKHLRWGRLAIEFKEGPASALQNAPRHLRPRRRLTPLGLRARRCNSLHSTGPRTTVGRQRSALNSVKWRLSTRGEQTVMALEGRDPFEYRRLARLLIHLFRPWNYYTERLVANLAEDWWKKLGDLRLDAPAGQTPEPRPSGVWEEVRPDDPPLPTLDSRIDDALQNLIDALGSHSRKWYSTLTKRLGNPIPSVESLREAIESRFRNMREPASDNAAPRKIKFPTSETQKHTKIVANG